MRNYKAEGIIVKRRNFKESDRILTVFTRDFGKIYVKAVGVRRITSRRSGHIEPLNRVIMSLYPGKVFPVLTDVGTLNSFSYLKTNLDRVALSYHICELIDGLCPENQENRAVFDLLNTTLEKLSASDDTGKAVSEFEMQILSILGYLPAGRQGWNKSNFAEVFDTESFIENILERRLRSLKIFAKIQQ
jgi:DNA repair protein RecO (recombination protein O)